MRNEIIYYRGYKIVVSGCWYVIDGYPDNLFEWLDDAKKFIDNI